MRFPADFSRNLDTFQPAPMQLILDGRNPIARKSPPLSATDRQGVSADIDGRRQSPTIANWWYTQLRITRIWTTSGLWCPRSP
ncbi:hypothetical protein KCP78_02720 [Salmonella enterica subsp. enterica]|nr:hypothetical protein KCP78_02720 [Salmonella enterica subsp. enterica]